MSPKHHESNKCKKISTRHKTTAKYSAPYKYLLSMRIAKASISSYSTCQEYNKFMF